MTGNWIDVAIVVVVGLSMFTGLMRGFVKELIALIAWVLAIFLSFKYMHLVSVWLMPYAHDKTLSSALAFIIILVVMLVAAGIVNAILSFLLRHSGLSGTDRILGMAFGLARGLLIVTLILLVAGLTDLPKPADRTQSRLYGNFSPMVAWMAVKTEPLFEHLKNVDVDQVMHKKKSSH